jgi:phosphoserine phosphatase RsbU/P
MKILIAEDDLPSRRILQVSLEKLGQSVVSASDGEEAWEYLADQPADVIVSDWMMPRLDGLELCHRVRQRAQVRYVYFILLTARTGHENYLQAMESGVDDFLSKPLRMEELTIRLRVAERIIGYIGEVRELKRLLPICAYCKRIRDDQAYWHDIESYMRAVTGSDFSHGICPECYESQVKPELDQLEEEHRGREGGPAGKDSG